MAKRQTKEDLVDALDRDIAWRRLEISALRSSLGRASGPAEATAARTCVALSYAHWEGYVVTSARTLVTYVAGLRLTYAELADPYVALCLAGALSAADQSTRRIQKHIDVVTALRQSTTRAHFPPPERIIHGEGNLKSEKFNDILARLGLAKSPFELHYNWVDSELLRRRNTIAHGEVASVDPTFALEALGTVAGLIDGFRTAVQNAAVLEVFKA